VSSLKSKSSSRVAANATEYRDNLCLLGKDGYPLLMLIDGHFL